MALFLSFVESAVAEDLIAYPGYKGEYSGYSLVIDERFDDFNTSVWKKGDGAVGTESMCRFTDEGVSVVDGLLELTISQQHVPAGFSEDHQMQKVAYEYACGELRSQALVHYGRFEARMRAPARATASGYIASLFTYSNDEDKTPREWEEIDIELEGGRPDKFQANLIFGLETTDWLRTRDYGAWEHKIEIGPVDEWRVFAFEWLPDRINWYVDGELLKTLRQADIDCDPECVSPQKHPTPIPNDPTTLMANFWIPNDIIEDAFGGNKHANQYPMKTQYDWIRVYQLDD